VLSTLFWLLSMWAYAHWVRQRAAQQPRASVFYGLALASFALGLMSKPMLVMVPCVLLCWTSGHWSFWVHDRPFIAGRIEFCELGCSRMVTGG